MNDGRSALGTEEFDNKLAENIRQKRDLGEVKQEDAPIILLCFSVLHLTKTIVEVLLHKLFSRNDGLRRTQDTETGKVILLRLTSRRGVGLFSLDTAMAAWSTLRFTRKDIRRRWIPSDNLSVPRDTKRKLYVKKHDVPTPMYTSFCKSTATPQLASPFK